MTRSLLVDPDALRVDKSRWDPSDDRHHRPRSEALTIRHNLWTWLSTVVPTAQRRALLRGGIFDAGWYATAYPASGADGADPARRYLTEGTRRGHRPHPLFDPAWYGATRRGVSGNPVLGYQNQLAPLGPDASAWFDVAWVLACGFQPTPGRTLLATWLAADPATRPPPCAAIDPDWYRTAYPDVAQAGVDPALHLAASGAADGRSPGPVFDSSLYRGRYPNVRAGDWTAWEHYRAIGAQQGRVTHRAFDPDWYGRRPEASGVGRAHLFAHYARHGRTGWHSPHPTLPAPGFKTCFTTLYTTCVVCRHVSSEIILL
jgi:hypothetical protein